jgi:hypothetical protein
MVRTLPKVPAIGDGSQRFQPIWHEDLAEGLAIAADLPGLSSRVLEVAGAEVISQGALIDRMQTMTGRKVPKLPIPEFVASLGIRAMNATGVGAPIAESQLAMLREENIIAEGRPNALVQDLGVRATPLDEGLRRFVDEQDIQLPEEGVGTLQQKIFAVDVRPSVYDASRLFEYLRDHLLDVFPSLVDSNPEDSNPSRISEGETLTLSLPVRGHVQVRVAEAAEGRITLMTLDGHPLAGAVRFITLPIDGGVHFEIQVFDRPANIVDWVLMRPIGDRMQEATWQQVARAVAAVAGDPQAEVKQVVHDLDAAQSDAVVTWARDLALRTKRREAAAEIADTGGSSARS